MGQVMADAAPPPTSAAIQTVASPPPPSRGSSAAVVQHPRVPTSAARGVNRRSSARRAGPHNPPRPPPPGVPCTDRPPPRPGAAPRAALRGRPPLHVHVSRAVLQLGEHRLEPLGARLLPLGAADPPDVVVLLEGRAAPIGL